MNDGNQEGGSPAVNLTMRRAITAAAGEESDADPIPRDDEALVAAAQVDRAAFAPLYQRYADPVFRFCYRRLGDRALAEDATSRVFERVLAALSRYRQDKGS